MDVQQLDAGNEAERLFFEIGGAHGRLSQYFEEIAGETELLTQTKDLVAAKVAAHAADYLSAIAI